ncbi:KdsC family phosphatase [Fulvivirga sedimenti]|uniref:3-deoxy-D-manno-octulosonate 8-phosphate phosphatase KdsC n=1 Tax=Fulvivirga sedimenti TaxID=2879465 RepID=A0A9X1HJU2_9BACT|nr:HAD hydrolase family protein [Fulvivirga sedimenti]MCA6073438.1 HAD hydrolase family protein [Fulvivirga sedimenti]
MENILLHYPEDLRRKAARIRAIVFDVDGVLTDGGIIYSNSGDEAKRFHVRDGAIIRPLKEEGFITGAITGRSSELVEYRMNELKVDFCFQAVKNKFSKIREIAERHSLELDEICYIGDDMIDMASLEAVGLGAVPADTPNYVADVADLITKAKGGEGVLREVADFVLAAQGKMQKVLESFTSRK